MRALQPLILALVLTLTSAVQADVIEQTNTAGTGAGLLLDRVTIQSISDGAVQFQNSAGRTGSIELPKIWRIEVDGQNDLNRAEQGLVNEDWSQAISGYSRAVRINNPAWIAPYAARRLLEVGRRSGEFEASVLGYATLATLDPAAAAAAKPGVPADAGDLQGAQQVLEEAAQRRNLTPAQSAPLLSLLLEIQQARNDAAGAEQTLAKLVELGGKGGDSALQGTQSTVRLAQARVSLQNKDYAAAQQSIDENRQLFDLPVQQAEALYLRAEALHGQAGDDREKLLDAALAYMRVVAHFSSTPEQPHVAESLLKTGMIHEQLGETANARRLYQQVQTEFPQSAAAGTAAERISQLPAEDA